MNLLQRYQEFIKKENLFSPKDKLLLAVSGGIDSVVLCELCKQGGYDFSIVHCNFQLRADESDKDEEFVRSLGEKYNVDVEVKKFYTEAYAESGKISIQEAARQLRYGWFIQRTEAVKYVTKKNVFLLTAHHADDNAETVFMNYLRGTGLHGLTGIPLLNDHIRRPMLSFTREEILQFAKKNNIEFVEDSSNQSNKYTRNFFRNEIIPAISKIYPEVKANLLDNIDRFKEIDKLYNFAVGDIKKKLIKGRGSELHIPIRQLMGYNNRALIYEIISDYGFNEKQIDEVIKLSDSESGKYIDSPAFKYRIIKHRHWFIVSLVQSAESGIIIIEEKDKKAMFTEGSLQFEQLTSNLKLEGSNFIALLDTKQISFPLILRKWKTGDYFYPLGMNKKKKLSRFFIDQKLSKTEKEKMWVIEMNKKIIWVVGKRIDERFKVTDKTKSVLKISYDQGV